VNFFIFEIISSGVVIGIIFFQTFFVAPIIFSSIEESQSRIFIRKIFPKLFTLLSIIGFIMILSNLFLNLDNKVKYISIINFIIPLICYLIIPATNRATDRKDKKMFKTLHMTSVLLTIFVLFSNMILPFFNTYKLFT